MARKPKHTKDKLADAVDAALHKALTEGETVLDAEGKPVKLSPSAKMIEVAIKRLGQLGITTLGTGNSGKQADVIQLIKERQAAGTLRFPPPPAKLTEADAEPA